MLDPKDILSKTLTVIAEGQSAGLHLGAQLYVSLKGEPVADLAVGESRAGVALQSDTIMLWLSASKPLTAVAIAQQWEQSKLHLDDPVCRFIPEFGNLGKGVVTVRHLLTHSAGFRSADKIPEDLGWDETINCICQTPLELDWVPGEKGGYHDSSSWFLLGEIVRRLDGRRFDRYVREMIFEPIGMHDSWLGMPSAAYRRYGDRIGVMHRVEKGQSQPHPFWNSEEGCALCRPGSNGRGPVRELGRFYEMLLGGKEGRRSLLPEEKSHSAPRVLKPETVLTFTTRHRVGLYDQTFQHIIDFGLGFIINSNRYGIDTLPYGYGRHASEATFGHSGAQSSCAFADPKHGLVVAWAFNGMPGERLHQKRARELNTAIYEDLKLV